MHRDDVITTLNDLIGSELLAKAAIKDEMANGVQIQGNEKIAKIAFGVSCNEQFLTKAIEWGAQLCVFHHGLDLRTDCQRLPIYTQKRLELIFENNLTIIGYHYALDAHPEIGNNAQIIQKLGGTITSTLFDEWGYTAKLNSKCEVKSLKSECERLFDHRIMSFGDENSEIETIGVVSGAGRPHQIDIEEMQSKGIELYISGETSEHIPHMFTEAGINYFVCGHYATETFGVKALMHQLQTQLGDTIETKFFDIPNPI